MARDDTIAAGGDTFAAELLPLSALGLDARAGWAFLLDIDGTLLDLADHPDRVEVPPALLPALRALRERASGALALVTGRGLASADRVFGDEFDCASNHGARIRIDGEVPPATVDEAAVLGRVVEDLAVTIDAHPGAWIERKSHSVAVHWRAVPAAAGEIARAVRSLVASHLSDWRLIEGKGVIEVASRAATKGTAVERLLASPRYVGRKPFYAGDDVTDEDAFQAVARLGGAGVLVGSPRRTYATHVCPSPADFRRWIEALVEDA